jgi:fructose/tagatose bisphosphate aldolase
MPVATPEQYAEMLDRAKAGGFAYPAFNASSSQSVNAILQGLTEAGSDGIIQVTTGGADYFAGHTVKNRAAGALAMAKFVHAVADNYPITVALHTDHCPKNALDDAIATVEALGLGENGRYMSALTFGNVHGVYKPGNVQLRPALLKEIQDGIQAKYGTGAKPLDLVFHGGSGSTDAEIAEAVANGVVKMNIDTDTQYAYTRGVAGWMFQNYEGVLKIAGEVGNKKVYDPRSYGKAAEAGMAQRVVEACNDLKSAGKKLG